MQNLKKFPILKVKYIYIYIYKISHTPYFITEKNDRHTQFIKKGNNSLKRINIADIFVRFRLFQFLQFKYNNK